MRFTVLTIVGLIFLGQGLTAHGGRGRSFTVQGDSKYHVFEEYDWYLDSVVLRDHQRRHTLVPYRWLAPSDKTYVDSQPGVTTREEVRRGRASRPNKTSPPGPSWSLKYNWKYPGEWKYRFK